MSAPNDAVRVSGNNLTEWRGWLDGNDSRLLDILEAIEELANESDARMRMLRTLGVGGPPVAHDTRFDDTEEQRNKALHAIRMIRSVGRDVREGLFKAQYPGVRDAIGAQDGGERA